MLLLGRISLLFTVPKHLGDKRRFMEIEHFFICPYCWQEISVVLDLTIDEQSYVEDCEVCCRPITLRYTAEDDELIEFDAMALDE